MGLDCCKIQRRFSYVEWIVGGQESVPNATDSAQSYEIIVWWVLHNLTQPQLLFAVVCAYYNYKSIRFLTSNRNTSISLFVSSPIVIELNGVSTTDSGRIYIDIQSIDHKSTRDFYTHNSSNTPFVCALGDNEKSDI